MPYMFSEMQNKLSKTRDSPLESIGQIISSQFLIIERLSATMQLTLNSVGHHLEK